MKQELFENTHSSEDKSSKTVLFEALLKEDCCASDFAGFVPENAGDLKKKEEEGSQVC